MKPTPPVCRKGGREKFSHYITGRNDTVTRDYPCSSGCKRDRIRKGCLARLRRAEMTYHLRKRKMTCFGMKKVGVV